MDLLGSIHMHPDWHRLGPPSERGQPLSERPTPMDRHLFSRAGWPLNIICYLERRGDSFYHALAAWAPPPQQVSEGTGFAGPMGSTEWDRPPTYRRVVERRGGDRRCRG
ncbi:hypothetical protein ACWD4G_26445 [Streptomyces sp. NPDC002643]